VSRFSIWYRNWADNEPDIKCPFDGCEENYYGNSNVCTHINPKDKFRCRKCKQFPKHCNCIEVKDIWTEEREDPRGPGWKLKDKEGNFAGFSSVGFIFNLERYKEIPLNQKDIDKDLNNYVLVDKFTLEEEKIDMKPIELKRAGETLVNKEGRYLSVRS